MENYKLKFMNNDLWQQAAAIKANAETIMRIENLSGIDEGRIFEIERCVEQLRAAFDAAREKK